MWVILVVLLICWISSWIWLVKLLFGLIVFGVGWFSGVVREDVGC